LKLSLQISVSLKLSGSEFQTDGPAAEKARWSNTLGRRTRSRHWQIVDTVVKQLQTLAQSTDKTSIGGVRRWTQPNIMTLRTPCPTSSSLRPKRTRVQSQKKKSQ